MLVLFSASGRFRIYIWALWRPDQEWMSKDKGARSCAWSWHETQALLTVQDCLLHVWSLGCTFLRVFLISWTSLAGAAKRLLFTLYLWLDPGRELFPHCVVYKLELKLFFFFFLLKCFKPFYYNKVRHGGVRIMLSASLDLTCNRLHESSLMHTCFVCKYLRQLYWFFNLLTIKLKYVWNARKYWKKGRE